MFDMDLLTALGAAAGAGVSRYSPLLSRVGMGGYESWRPGNKLKILFVGYNGAGNAGADARASAMARQFESVLGLGGAEISVLTQDLRSMQAYVDPHVQLVRLDPIFFGGVLKACSGHHISLGHWGETIIKSKLLPFAIILGSPCFLRSSKTCSCVPFIPLMIGATKISVFPFSAIIMAVMFSGLCGRIELPHFGQ